MKFKSIIILFLTAIIFSCSTENNNNQIVVGIPTDIETLNPLYAFSVEEGNVAELLYLSLVQNNWDEEKGEIVYTPLLAKKWTWDESKKSIIIELKDNVYWNDGVKCSIEDIIFSFDIYSDPKVQSRFLGYFENFYTDKDGYIDSSKTFEKLDSNRLKIKFKDNSQPQLIDIDYPIIPKHFWNKFKREEIPTLHIPSYISNGAFILERWEKEEAIILAKNPKCFLVNKGTVNRLIFKVIPEYQNRLSQLITGDIDLMEDIKTDDITNLRENSKLTVVPISGRDFDYIGWNNISTIDYQNGKILPHKLFGSAEVRRALTIALNREIVVDEYLNGYGAIALSPVSKIFNSIYNSTIPSLKFNSTVAKQILNSEGWNDSNGNGTIDKNGVEFSFILHIPSGNPRREFAASLFQNNLKAIGIDVVIESNELGVFIDNLFTKQFDAWMAAWVVPIPINLRISWSSDLEQTPLNFASFQNKEIDLLFESLENTSENEKVEIYKRVQEILHNEQPYSFLYWIDNIACYNKRINNISIDPLGAVKQCWNWEVQK